MGSIIPSLLSRIGVDIIALNSYASPARGFPSLTTLKKLSKVISSTEATFGVCFDVDGSRAIFFDERGNYISSDIVLI
jgi:phosphomannomutase